MKPAIITVLFILAVTIIAQAQLFIRVYDLNGKKTYKGRVYTTTDSVLVLEIHRQPVNIAINEIGTIKTKHTAGNNILMGVIAGALPLAIVGAATADPDAEILGYNAGEGAAAGAIIGTAAGAVIGAITILFKHPKNFAINGKPENWQTFRKYTNSISPKN